MSSHEYKPLTPDQLRRAMTIALQAYAVAYAAKKSQEPNYIHTDLDGNRYKIGYMNERGGKHFIIKISSRELHHGE